MSTTPTGASSGNPDPNVSGPAGRPTPPQTQPAIPGQSAQQMSKLRQFLGASATPEQVNQFLKGFLQFFNIMIQQSNQAHQRAQEQLKKTIEGDE
ncbi:MAG TPA: hypothetical protein VJ112_02405 [Rhabdochlamydiaceae bacterium]|nr:hypothetical protein [Rhabdochlamydiaceae bacterium]